MMQDLLARSLMRNSAKSCESGGADGIGSDDMVNWDQSVDASGNVRAQSYVGQQVGATAAEPGGFKQGPSCHQQRLVEAYVLMPCGWHDVFPDCYRLLCSWLSAGWYRPASHWCV